MANRSRPFLKDKFQTGDTPTEENFADLIDSFISKADDNISLDGNNNLNIPAGINLTNAATGQDGTLRFNGTNVEVFKGGAWTPISGGNSGPFVLVGAGPDVAFAGGNVGIGTLTPTHKLDIPLAANSGTVQQVRFGNLAIHNGQTNEAYIGNQSAPTDLNYALKQDTQSNTTVNAGNNAALTLSQNNVARLQVLVSGNISLTPAASVSIGGNTVIGSPAPGLDRNLIVFGTASKPGGGTFLPTASDSRVKKDVKQLDVGLEQLRKLNPVYYKYNGEAGTPNDGKEYVGLIAQEVQKVIPSLILKSENAEHHDRDDILTYDPNPLTFMMIKAIQELSEKVEKLEAQLGAKSKGKG